MKNVFFILIIFFLGCVSVVEVGDDLEYNDSDFIIKYYDDFDPINQIGIKELAGEDTLRYQENKVTYFKVYENYPKQLRVDIVKSHYTSTALFPYGKDVYERHFKSYLSRECPNRYFSWIDKENDRIISVGYCSNGPFSGIYKVEDDSVEIYSVLPERVEIKYRDSTYLLDRKAFAPKEAQYVGDGYTFWYRIHKSEVKKYLPKNLILDLESKFKYVSYFEGDSVIRKYYELDYYSEKKVEIEDYRKKEKEKWDPRFYIGPSRF